MLRGGHKCPPYVLGISDYLDLVTDDLANLCGIVELQLNGMLKNQVKRCLSRRSW